MKKNIAAIVIILFLASTSVSFARGNRGGNNHGHPRGGHPSSYGYQGRSHHNDGLGIAVGVVGGLLLGSALMYPPPPRTVAYVPQYTPYQPPTVVQQPRICVERHTVTGEWQTNRYDGRQIWVSFPYPVTTNVQVPCY